MCVVVCTLCCGVVCSVGVCGVVRLGMRKTPPCVDSKRLLVCVQDASVCITVITVLINSKNHLICTTHFCNHFRPNGIVKVHVGAVGESALTNLAGLCDAGGSLVCATDDQGRKE